MKNLLKFYLFIAAFFLAVTCVQAQNPDHSQKGIKF
jgi:hypothetical protein